MRKGLIFDLDGVIADTAKYHYIAWKELAQKIGIEIDEKFNENLKGMSREKSLDLILAHGGKSAIFSEEEKTALGIQKNEAYLKLLEGLSSQDILPGLLAILDEADKQNIPSAIASASRNAPFILDKLGIKNRFTYIVDPATLKNGKPDPEIYLKAAKGINIKPEEAIGFEDAQSGVNAIKAANMYAIGVLSDGVLENVDLMVNSLEKVKISSILNK